MSTRKSPRTVDRLERIKPYTRPPPTNVPAKQTVLPVLKAKRVPPTKSTPQLPTVSEVDERPIEMDQTMPDASQSGSATRTGEVEGPASDLAADTQQQILRQLAFMVGRMDEMQQQVVSVQQALLARPITNGASQNGTGNNGANHNGANYNMAYNNSSSNIGASNNGASNNGHHDLTAIAPNLQNPPTSSVIVNSELPPPSNCAPYMGKPVDLPEFSGLPEQWPVFMASFEQSTAAFTYTPLQNVFRLQKCLKGEARDAVQFLLISPDCVDELIDVLRFRFGRPEILAQSQLAKIREIPEMNERNIDQLITYSSRVQNMVAFLGNDDNRHVLGETTLLAELVGKLPPSKRMEWAKYSVDIKPRPTAIEFSGWLKTVAQYVATITTQTTTATKNIAAVSSARQSSTHNNFTGARQQQQRPYNKHVVLNVTEPSKRGVCCMCTKTHKLSECDKFVMLPVDERWRVARKNYLCFGCLRSGHMFEKCFIKRNCPINDCVYSHHEMLHGATDTAGDSDGAREEQRTATVGGNPVGNRSSNPFQSRPNASTSTVLTCYEGHESLPLLFRVVPVTLHGPASSTHTYALLDEGSSVTMLDAALAESLRLTGPVSNLSVQWIGGRTSTEPSREVTVQISGYSSECATFQLNRVRTVRNLDLPSQTVQMSQLISRWHHLRGLPIAELHHAKPKLLIGLDNCHLGVASITKTAAGEGPVAAHTKLGWIVYGPQVPNQNAPIARLLHASEADQRYEQLHQIIENYFTTESFGVRLPDVVLEPEDDVRAREILRSTTVRVNDRFETGLLWCSDTIALPDSYAMACQRLETVERKIRRDPAYGEQYTKQIDAYVAKGYARKLSVDEARENDCRTWYLPHFCVRAANKPSKLRLVFDAAASVKGVSLNSVLLKGPDLNQPLATILFKFRLRRIGVCADIAEMFHQVLVRKQDRHSQRFLWGRTDGKPDVYEMLVMTFGATCSPTAAQFVKNMNASELEHQFPDAAAAIKTMHYVDDFVASFGSEDDAVRVTRDVVDIHRRGGFILRGFVSNSRSVLNGLGVESAESAAVDMQLSKDEGAKILGMHWCTQNDSFMFTMNFSRVDTDVVSGVRCPTKREMLSAAMSVFDPFGFLANFVLPAKLLVQQLWRTGVTWDEPVPENIYEQWRIWCLQIENTKLCRIRRCYSAHMMTSTNTQLHIFADASEEAFAAVAYWRIGHGDEFELAFVLGKTKCAPIKTLSVPRLELQAAVLAARMYVNIRDSHEIPIHKLFMWTDSRTVIQWIQSTTRRFRPFVNHRVSEILECTGSTCWQWLPTHLNVADDATRARPQMAFDPDSRWLRGPEFLIGAESSWPTSTVQKPLSNDVELPDEIRPKFMGAVFTGGNLFEFNRYSNFLRLCRAAGWLLRFVNNARAKSRKKSSTSGELRSDEIREATEMLCRIVQREVYFDEYTALANGKQVETNSSVSRLMPYMDDNRLMRLFGRTDAAEIEHLPRSAQRPILLPKSHRFTELLTHHHHAKMAHQFEDGVICAIRQQYWVPHIRSLVRTVKQRCMVCKIRLAQPRPTIAGQLPPDRLQPYVHPFSFTGLDYFGPVSVTIGRRHEKRWIALFTCLTTRAIHLEIAADLSTDACLLCIRNFVNLRGVPTRIRSDCGTNFVGADNIIRRAADFIDVNVIGGELSAKGIQWVFNFPANPEAGGAWERLVQSTKRVLAITLKEVAPHVETLRSLIIEAANIINSRPLTHIPVSPEDPEPLTPNHFLLGRANSTCVPGPIEPKLVCTRKQWQVCKQLQNRFWSKWVRDYLPELTRRTKHYQDVPALHKGDLVLVCDSNQSRGQWLRGRIEKVIRGTDGRVRLAEVRTTTGVLRRPVAKLALLDVIGELPSGETHGGRDVANSSDDIV